MKTGDKWHKIWALAFAVAAPIASYLGYGEYERRSLPAEPITTTVNVSVEGIDAAPSAPVHVHGVVLSRDTIKAIIAAAIADQHKADVIIFKQKESWEK